jgi:hypothetical protein
MFDFEITSGGGERHGLTKIKIPVVLSETSTDKRMRTGSDA